LKPTQANSSTSPYLEKPFTKLKKKKTFDGVAQGEGPEFKPQYHKKKNMKIFSKMITSNSINRCLKYIWTSYKKQISKFIIILEVKLNLK
jgi:hypothetical protein